RRSRRMPRNGARCDDEERPQVDEELTDAIDDRLLARPRLGDDDKVAVPVLAAEIRRRNPVKVSEPASFEGAKADGARRIQKVVVLVEHSDREVRIWVEDGVPVRIERAG